MSSSSVSQSLGVLTRAMEIIAVLIAKDYSIFNNYSNYHWYYYSQPYPVCSSWKADTLYLLRQPIGSLGKSRLKRYTYICIHMCVYVYIHIHLPVYVTMHISTWIWPSPLPNLKSRKGWKNNNLYTVQLQKLEGPRAQVAAAFKHLPWKAWPMAFTRCVVLEMNVAAVSKQEEASSEWNFSLLFLNLYFFVTNHAFQIEKAFGESISLSTTGYFK